jgi:hypothetical protein
MNEASLKGSLVAEGRTALTGYVVCRHEDRFTSGYPDISVDGNYRTSWWEVKFANPDFASTGIQELTMKRKARAAWFAGYIIYDSITKRVFIVHPDNLETWSSKFLERFPGYNHKAVVEYIRQVHERTER